MTGWYFFSTLDITGCTYFFFYSNINPVSNILILLNMSHNILCRIFHSPKISETPGNTISPVTYFLPDKAVICFVVRFQPPPKRSFYTPPPVSGGRLGPAVGRTRITGWLGRGRSRLELSATRSSAVQGSSYNDYLTIRWNVATISI